MINIDYFYLTISAIVLIVTYFTCLWLFRAIVLILFVKLAKGLVTELKAKLGGADDAKV
jgi:hypothetical protein